jgi:hypothetical protein
MLNALDVVRIARKLHTREELLQRLFSAARSINNVAVLRSLVTRVRKFVKAFGGRFEHLAWVFNGESVTFNNISQ